MILETPSLSDVKGWPAIAFAVLAFVISAFMLSAAYAFQHIGGLAPCQMCYWQRHAHKAVLMVSAAVLFLRLFGVSARVMHAGLYLIALAFLISAGFGGWHMGVEFGWWEGPKACAVAPIQNFNPEDFLKSLDQPIKTPACSDVTWSMLGLSMAGWNALISLLASLLLAMSAGRKEA